jgi:hypothetical protein
MGYEQDYIKRMIQRLGEVLARALGLGKSGEFEESIRVLEQGVGSELGMPFPLLLRLEPQSAVSLLGREKAAAFAEALRTRSLLFGFGGHDKDAEESRALAESIEQLLG